MIETNLEGAESIRIARADANLRITGGADRTVARSDRQPKVARDTGTAEISFDADAEIRVCPGVIVEVKDCGGNLDVDDVATPLPIFNVGGNLRVRNAGAVTVRAQVGGNIVVHTAERIEADRVGGNLSADSVHGVVARSIGGNAECRDVTGDVVVERIGGSARFKSVGGKASVRSVGGKLGAYQVGAIQADAIGGKLKAVNVAGAIAVGKIGGRMVVDGAGGEITAAFVGGHAEAARLATGLSLPEVGGAFDLRGPYPAGANFRVRSRGRARVELPQDTLLELNARSRWGRIRVIGADPNDLKWADYNRLEGIIGSKSEGARPARLEIETTDGDIMLIGAEAARDDYDYCRTRRPGRFGRRLAEQFGDFAREWSEGIPEFVGGVTDAVRRFVAESGIHSATMMRGVAEDVREGVGDALRDIERALSEVRGKVPDDVAERLAQLGRELGDAVARVAEAARSCSRDVKHDMRIKVRQAAREMSEAIREAAARARESAEDSRQASDVSRGEQGKDDAPREKPVAHDPREEQIIKILEAVRTGDIELEEADDLIRAWFDVDAVTGNGNETA